MPRGLHNLPTHRVLRAFQRAGWHTRPRKDKGPHYVLTKEGHEAIVSIPRHARVKKGLLLKQLDKAGMTVEDFLAVYR